MAISVSNPQAFYQFFYVVAFLFMFSVVIYKSIKHGYHLRTVLLMLTTMTLFTVIGSRLFTIPIEEWITALNSNFATYNNRSSIGGLLFGLAGFFISQRIFGFKRPILDLFAWVGPVTIGITKLGCLFNGCCYGLPFNGFLGIQYQEETHAHLNHWLSGSIETDALLSLSVHPVQLYDSLMMFLVGYIVWKTHKMWKKSLSAMLFSLFLFFTVRFGVEFFRDHSVSSFSTAYYWGVWSCQWGMLGLVLILGGFLWFYEKGMKTKTTKGLQNKPYIQAEFTYIIIISFFVYTFNNLLLPYEFMVVWIMFIPAILLSFYYLFTENRLSNHRQLICIFLLTPFYVLAQTIPDQTPEIKQYKRIDVGGSFGNFANQVAFNPQQTSNECGTTTSYDYNTFKQVYEMGGVGFSQVTIKNNNTLRYGINLSGGTVKSTDLETNDTQSEFIYAANPFVKWDGKWFGIGTGFQLGKLRVNKYETLDISNIDDAQKNYNLLPEFYMRVGQKKYVDIDYNYGFMIPSAYPTLYSRSSIGSGFGLSQDYSLRYGQIWNLETGYIAAEGLLNNNLGVNIMYVFKENNFQFQENEASGKFILSLNYRFGHKTK